MKATIYIYDFLHILRINISIFLINILSKIKKNSSVIKNLKFIFLSFKEKGYCDFKNFFTLNEIKYMQSLLLKDTISYTQSVSKSTNLEIKEGMMKVKAIENFKPEIKKFLNTVEFFLISIFFYFKFKKCLGILSLSQSEDNQIPGLKGKCVEPIANTPHVDSFRPYLKGIIFLEDVDIDNGPTAIFPKSVSREFINGYVNLHKNKKTHFSYENIYAFLNENQKKSIKSKAHTLVGKKGDLILFDSRDIHWATDLKSGSRKVLHLYF